MSDQSYVVVFSVYTDLDELDATLFQELLAKNGIQALLIPIGDTLKRLTFGGLGNTPLAQLAVAPEHAEIAKQLIEEYKALEAGVFQVKDEDVDLKDEG